MTPRKNQQKRLYKQLTKHANNPNMVARLEKRIETIENTSKK